MCPLNRGRVCVLLKSPFPKCRHLLSAVWKPYGLSGRGGARGNREVHLLCGGNVQALPDHRALPPVHLALPALLETVHVGLGLSLQNLWGTFTATSRSANYYSTFSHCAEKRQLDLWDLNPPGFISDGVLNLPERSAVSMIKSLWLSNRCVFQVVVGCVSVASLWTSCVCVLPVTDPCHWRSPEPKHCGFFFHFPLSTHFKDSTLLTCSRCEVQFTGPAAFIPRQCCNSVFTARLFCHLLDSRGQSSPLRNEKGEFVSHVSQLKSSCRKKWRRSSRRCTCSRTWRARTSPTCWSVIRWRSRRSWAASLNSCWQEWTQWVCTGDHVHWRCTNLTKHDKIRRLTDCVALSCRPPTPSHGVCTSWQRIQRSKKNYIRRS